jgi:hypothetical protein
MLTLSNKQCDLLAKLIFAVVGLLIILTFRDYGITWDEELQSQYGQAVVDYYASLFKDHRFQQIFNLYLYGGMFDGVASVIDGFTPFSVYETRHLVNAFFGLLGLWGTYRIGKFLGGGFGGLVALTLLILTPMYYGHMFNNPKDIPFAAGILWSIYYMAKLYEQGAHCQRSTIIKLGIIYGLTLGVRVGGVMLFAFWLVPWGWDACRIFWSERNFKSFRQAFQISLRRAIFIILPVFILSFGVMLICWPWAQQDPIVNPLRALSEFSNFPQDVEVLLDGTVYRSTQLPWTYVPLYFSVQLPELILFLLALTPFFAFSILKNLLLSRRQILTVIVMMASIPILYAVLRHPALYDAVRHFLFAVPLACIVSALTLQAILRKLELKNTHLATLVAVLILGTFICSQAFIMCRLQPYEYIFINHFAGGVQGAYGRYEIDYWGSSFKEAAEKLQAFVAKEGGVPPGKIYRVAICGPWDSAMIYLPPDYRPVVANEPAEFFLSTTRWMCQNMRPGKEIIRVKRLGAPLSIIKDLRGGFEKY